MKLTSASNSAFPPSWSLASCSVADTECLGAMIGNGVQGGEVFALYGEVGTGKTALVRGIAAGLGAAPRSVSSPTFVLIHEYRGRLLLAHADLYRLESPQTMPHLGLEEYFDGRTIVAVEWAERAMNELPLDRVDIRFAHQSETERTIIIAATGPYSRQVLTSIFDQTSRLPSTGGQMRLPKQP
ncbi:MAG TPA: tRNA (adenosine(37)-N6)-threonylcarbamoyltransferase complex ATPase subunit type 1 TsaE [Nitrospiraceae bacterium]|nr:tRNA (adenosine(37)-N6)-threonylcarbamoyltransferase complex ATPase subunit type 1 TsaE [Nitrospiraceae bacterium]